MLNRGTSLTLTAATYATNGLPQLEISRSPGGVRLFWPLDYPADWILIATTNLVTPVWAPASVTCDHQTLLPTTEPEQYFQLRKSH